MTKTRFKNGFSISGLPHPAGMFAALLLIAGGPASARLSDAVINFDGTQTYVPKLPTLLSQTGLYNAGTIASSSRVISDGLVPFTVNTSLWSDAAAKGRWVQVPVGQKIIANDTSRYRFPDKTVFVKNFSIDTVYGNAASRILIETRFLVVRILDLDQEPSTPLDTAYYGISYRWNRAQTDAALVDQDAGRDDTLMVSMGGKTVGKRWRYPSFGDCMFCHSGRGVLGFFTPQINNGTQIQTLVDAGVLVAPPSGVAPAFRWYGLTDAGGSVEARVRSYFGSNCASCHGNGREMQGASHNMDFWSLSKSIKSDAPGGFIGTTTGREPDFPQLIYPAYPESSFILKRMMSRSTMTEIDINPMPPLATFQIDSSAVNLMKQWICEMGSRGAACKLPTAQADTFFWVQNPAPNAIHGQHGYIGLRRGVKAYFSGQELIVVGGPAARASLYDFTGREIPMRMLRDRHYQPVSPLRQGVYFLRAGRETTRVNYIP